MSGTNRRKQPWEYSTNKNTIRARARKARLSEYQRAVEQAKASDAKAVTRAWKLRVDTEVFKMSTEGERQLILENVEKEVMDRRRNKEIDADTKIKRFMNRMENNGGGGGAMSPNGTPAPGALAASVGESAPPSPRLAAPIPIMAPPAYGSFTQPPRGVRASTGPVLPYLVPSIERTAAAETPFPQPSLFTQNRPAMPSSLSYQVDQNDAHQLLPSLPRLQRDFQGHEDGNQNQPSPSVEQLQRDLAAALMTSTNLQNELNAARDTIRDLKGQVMSANNDLIVANSSVVAQEARMENLDNQQNVHGDASTLRRVMIGVQTIADAAADVANLLKTDNADSPRVSHDDSAIDVNGDN